MYTLDLKYGAMNSKKPSSTCVMSYVVRYTNKLFMISYVSVNIQQQAICLQQTSGQF